MNKKQLAKLLIKHSEIKALYESREFDASTINKIVAEEIMREDEADEDEEDDKQDNDAPQAANNTSSNSDEESPLVGVPSEDEDLVDLVDEISKALSFEQLISLAKEGDDLFGPNKKLKRAIDDAMDKLSNIKQIATKVEKKETTTIDSEAVKTAAIKAKPKIRRKINPIKNATNDNKRAGGWVQIDNELGTVIDDIKKSSDEAVSDAANATSDDADVSATPVQKTSLKLGGTSINKLKKLGQVLVGFSEQQADEMVQKLANLVQATDIEDASDTQWKDLPQDIKIYDSALSLFIPTEDGGLSLNPEVLSITPLEASSEAVDAFVIKKEELQTPEIKQEIENINQQVEKTMTQTKPGNRPLKSLRQKFNKLIKQQKYEEVRKIMSTLLDPAATLEDLKNVWGLVTPEFFEGMQAIAAEPTEAIAKAIAAANDALEKAQDIENSPAPEKVVPVVDNAISEIDTELEKFNKKTESIRQRVIKKISTISKKNTRVYEDMAVLQSRNFIIFLLQQMAKTRGKVTESVKSAMTNKSQRALAISAIEANKEEVATLSQDLSIDLAKAIKQKFGVEIRGTDEMQSSPEAVLKGLFAKWKEAGGNVEEFKKTITALSKKYTVKGGGPDIDRIESVIEKYLAGNNVSFDNADSSTVDAQGEMTDTVGIVASTLEDLDSSINNFPKLMANEEFKQLLSSALQDVTPVEDNDEANSDTDPNNPDSDGDGINDAEEDETDPTDADSDETVEEGLSGIFLTEDLDEDGSETDVVKPDSNVENPSPLSPEDATLIYNEVVKLKELFDNSERYKEIDVMDLATKVFGPISNNEALPDETAAAKEGQSSAEADASLQDARYEQLYNGFKNQLDRFFSKDGKKDGFMDQFLLKHQSRELATLLSVLQDIIRGDIPDDDEDNEGEARALSSKVQQSDAGLEEGLFGNKEEISKEGKVELQTSLVSMLKGVKSLKSMMDAYSKYASRSSANPMLDGSSLKKSLNKYMTRLQANIASIIERCEIEQSRLTQSSVDDIPVELPPENVEVGDDEDVVEEGLSGIFLTEEDDREGKLKIVNYSFGQMLNIYETSLSSSLEKQQTSLAIDSSRKILEFAKNEKFFSLFPSFVGTHNGAPQTIDQAITAVSKLMKEFIETMKKVILLSKGETIDETTLIKVIDDLENLSIIIENYFGIKSQLDPTIKEKVEKLLAQEEGSEAISDDSESTSERGNDEQGENAFIKKLRELFPNANRIVQNAEKMWARLTNPVDEEDMSRATEELEEAGEDDVNEVFELLGDAQTWLGGKSEKEYEALTNFANFIIEGLNDDSLSEGKILDGALEAFTEKDVGKLIEYALDRMYGNEKELVENMMQDEDLDFANFISAHLKTNKFSPTLRGIVLPDMDIPQASIKAAENVVKQIKPFVETLKTNSTQQELKPIDIMINQKFQDDNTLETMKQLLCYFILYSLPSPTNEAAESERPEANLWDELDLDNIDNDESEAADSTEDTSVDVFLGNIKKHAKLSTHFSAFISNNSANIKAVLSIPAIGELLEGKSTTIKYLTLQLGQAPAMKTIIDQLKKGEEASDEDLDDVTNDNESSVDDSPSNSTDVESDEEDAPTDPLSTSGSISDPELIEQLVDTGKLANAKGWSTLDPQGVKTQLEKIATNIPEDENKIKELQSLFFDLATLLQELKQNVAWLQNDELSEGLADAWNTVKTKVKTATNNFKSKSDLPHFVEVDLKKYKMTYPKLAKESRKKLTELISKIRNTGIKMKSTYGYVIWALYDEYTKEDKQRGIGNLIGSFDSEQESKRVRDKNNREMDMRAQWGDQINESTHKNEKIDLQEALRPIIEKMLNEHYNH